MAPVSETMRQAGAGRFSVVEVAVAVILVAVVVVGIQGLAAGPVAGAPREVDHPTALDLVEERIERIRMDPQYRQIPSRYGGKETTIAGWPGYTRLTRVAATRDSTTSGVVDWLTVTVTVTGPESGVAVTRTVTLGAL